MGVHVGCPVWETAYYNPTIAEFVAGSGVQQRMGRGWTGALGGVCSCILQTEPVTSISIIMTGR